LAGCGALLLLLLLLLLIVQLLQVLLLLRCLLLGIVLLLLLLLLSLIVGTGGADAGTVIRGAVLISTVPNQVRLAGGHREARIV